VDEFVEEMTAFLTVNWSSHIKSDMIGLLTSGQVRVITVAPRTTQIFQVFDVTFVGVLKRHPRHELPFGDEEVTVKFLMKVYHGFKQRTVDSNIWRAFSELLRECDTRNESDKLLFNEQKLRQRASFRALRSNNFSLDQLSTRPSVITFHWIHEPEQSNLTQINRLSIDQIPVYRSSSKIRKVELSRDSPYNFEGSTEI
jgi:hypothetical protein